MTTDHTDNKKPVLEPCPFCGAKPKLIEIPVEVHYYVMCIECGACGSDLHGKQDAINAWNSRVCVDGAAPTVDHAALERKGVLGLIERFQREPKRSQETKNAFEWLRRQIEEGNHIHHKFEPAPANVGRYAPDECFRCGLHRAAIMHLVLPAATAAPAEQSAQTWCDHCSADLNGVKHTLCERCYREFADSINTRESLRAAILDWLAHRCDYAPVCGNCTYCRVAAYVQSLEHFPATAAPVGLEWLPIETAPRDGTEILLAHGNSQWFDQWIADPKFEVRDGEGGCWMMCDQWEEPEVPSHWKPPPPLPNSTEYTSQETGE